MIDSPLRYASTTFAKETVESIPLYSNSSTLSVDHARRYESARSDARTKVEIAAVAAMNQASVPSSILTSHLGLAAISVERTIDSCWFTCRCGMWSPVSFLRFQRFLRFHLLVVRTDRLAFKWGTQSPRVGNTPYTVSGVVAGAGPLWVRDSNEIAASLRAS